MKKEILLLISLAACSSKPEPIITKEDQEQITNVPSQDIAICQVRQFRGAHKYVAQRTAYDLYNYRDLDVFLTQVQDAVLNCYRFTNEWDHVVQRLQTSAKAVANE